MARRFGCRCVVVEPSPQMFASLPAPPPIQKLQLAISGADGPVELHVSPNSQATGMFAPLDPSLGSVCVEGVTLQSLLCRIHVDRVDLLKVDIEGAEMAMFAAASDELLGRCTQLCVEFHDANGITDPAEIRLALQRFERLGFFWTNFTRCYFEDVLLINTNLVPLSAAQRCYLRRVGRSFMGIKRMIRRKVLGEH
jgi:FkbM family methyltransferase